MMTFLIQKEFRSAPVGGEETCTFVVLVTELGVSTSAALHPVGRNETQAQVSRV